MYKQNKRQSVQIVRKVLAVVVGILLVFAGFLGWQLIEPVTSGSRIVTASEKNAIREETLIKINSERTKQSLISLKENPLLTKAAQAKAQDMVNSDYFAHIRPSDGYKWSGFIEEQNYNYRFAGENLAKGYTSIEQMIQAWLNSPTHRDNLLSADYEETGIGYAYKKSDTGDVLYVVETFGTQFK
jgi:uncharacterized protein YkwD